MVVYSAKCKTSASFINEKYIFFKKNSFVFYTNALSYPMACIQKIKFSFTLKANSFFFSRNEMNLKFYYTTTYLSYMHFIRTYVIFIRLRWKIIFFQYEPYSLVLFGIIFSHKAKSWSYF